jgi:subtilisin
MLENNAGVSRRDVLKATAGSLATVSATGLAAAKPEDTVEVNVGFTSDRGRTAALDAADDVVREFNFDAVTIRAQKRAIDGLASRPGVRYVEENGRMHALCYPGCGYDRIDAGVAYRNGHTGAGADIAIIDTGIDSDHPNLRANLGRGKAFTVCGDCSCLVCSGNGNACYEQWDDDNDHGSHVSGIAAATESCECRRGVAPEATLHSVKVLDCQGSGSYSDIAAGIEYTADQGWDVANLSLGASSGSSTLKDACQYAYVKGVTLVAAAGNNGPCTDCVAYPAAYEEVIAVGAVDCDGNLSSFSSTGSEVEIVAPGEDVYSTIPGGCERRSGSSVAAPFVSGAAALLRSEGYSNAEARQRLRETAEDIGLASDAQGHGLLDVAAALGYDSSDD